MQQKTGMQKSLYNVLNVDSMELFAILPTAVRC